MLYHNVMKDRRGNQMFYSSCNIQKNNYVDQSLLSQIYILKVKEITKEGTIKKKKKETPMNAIEGKIKGKTRIKKLH